MKKFVRILKKLMIFSSNFCHGAVWFSSSCAPPSRHTTQHFHKMVYGFHNSSWKSFKSSCTTRADDSLNHGTNIALVLSCILVWWKSGLEITQSRYYSFDHYVECCESRHTAVSHDISRMRTWLYLACAPSPRRLLTYVLPNLAE